MAEVHQMLMEAEAENSGLRDDDMEDIDSFGALTMEEMLQVSRESVSEE